LKHLNTPNRLPRKFAANLYKWLNIKPATVVKSPNIPSPPPEGILYRAAKKTNLPALISYLKKHE